MSESNAQNTWFGVSMFLIGLMAGGAVMMGLSGGLPSRAPTGGTGGTAPTAPTQQVSAMDRMLALVDDLDLNKDEFTKCFAAEASKDEILSEMDMGKAEGVSGTPGNIVVNLKTKKAKLLSGAQPYTSFKTAIDDLLANPTGPNSAGTAEPVTVPTLKDDDHIRGNANADIAIFEYSDYQCPFCTRVHPTYLQVMDEYGDKVMWVYRHFPLTSIHPDALPLAIGSECVAAQGGNDAFWDYTDALFES